MASDNVLSTMPSEAKDPIRVGARPLLRDEIEEGEPQHLLFADEFGQSPSTALRMLQWFQAYAAEHVQSPLHRAAVLIRQIVTAIAASEHPKRVAVYHRLAFNFRESNHESMRSIAKELGVTVASVSKSVRALQSRYGLPSIGTFNKAPAAVETYRATNGRSRWNTAADTKFRGAHGPVWRIRHYAGGALAALRSHAEQHHAGRFAYDEIATCPKMVRYLDHCWISSKVDSWDEFFPVIRSMIEGDESASPAAKESIPPAPSRGGATPGVFSSDRGKTNDSLRSASENAATPPQVRENSPAGDDSKCGTVDTAH